MTFSDQPGVEITDEIRQKFFAKFQNQYRNIRQLRYALWWIRGCGIVILAVLTWMILSSSIVEFLPGSGLSVAVLNGTGIQIIAMLLVGAAIELYCVLKCAQHLKVEQIYLKETKDAGIQQGIITTGQIVNFKRERRIARRKRRQPYRIKMLNCATIILMALGPICVSRGLIMIGEPLAWIAGGIVLLIFGVVLGARWLKELRRWQKKMGPSGHELKW